MTITQDTSAPLVVVVGATGNQGSSVIKHLAESDKPYRVRALTRDPSKPASQELAGKGVELFVVNPTVENKEVFKAFEGATYAFAVTVSAVLTSKEQETAEGKMYVDAAKAANVKLLVWSGLPNFAKRSGGKYTDVVHFDAKADVTEYAKASGVPFVDVECGGYFQNYSTHFVPMKQPDGTFILFSPAPPDALLPLIDTPEDFGLFVRKAIEGGLSSGSEVHAYAEWISNRELMKIVSEITGKTINCVQVTEEQFNFGMQKSGRFSPRAIRQMYEMIMSAAEFGYFDNVGVQPSSEGLARKPRTWVEFAKATDWSKILA